MLLLTTFIACKNEEKKEMNSNAEQSKTEETRLQLIKDMYNFCDVPFNDFAKKAAEEWKPANKTFRLIKETCKKDPEPRWENFKEEYLNRNIEHTKKFMDIEIEALNKEEDLKRLMKKVGYKNVLWW